MIERTVSITATPNTATATNTNTTTTTTNTNNTTIIIMLRFAMKLFALGLAMAASTVHAYTEPTTQIKGNAILQPGMSSVLPVGEPFDIRWEPTTKGTVTFVLHSGPSSNALEPLYALVEGVPNNGLYTWTPKNKLQDTNGEDEGYGLMIIDDATGKFQWSMPFGIENPDVPADDADEVAPPPEGGSFTDPEPLDGDDDDHDAAPGYGRKPEAHGKGEGHGESKDISKAPYHSQMLPAQNRTGMPAFYQGGPSNSTIGVAGISTGTGTARHMMPTGIMTTTATAIPIATITSSAPAFSSTTASPSGGGAAGLAWNFVGIAAGAGVAVLAL